jgi:hypothetical protein
MRVASCSDFLSILGYWLYCYYVQFLTALNLAEGVAQFQGKSWIILDFEFQVLAWQGLGATKNVGNPSEMVGGEERYARFG